jgi:hypothetical protein
MLHGDGLPSRSMVHGGGLPALLNNPHLLRCSSMDCVLGLLQFMLDGGGIPFWRDTVWWRERISKR